MQTTGKMAQQTIGINRYIVGCKLRLVTAPVTASPELIDT